MLIGYISQVFFSICLLPQCVALFTRKTTKGISVGMWILQGGGYLTGLWYGIAIHQWPLILGQIWGIICSIVFAIGYWRYRNV